MNTKSFIFEMRQLLNELEFESQKEYGSKEYIMEKIKNLCINT